jgi:hypothetical protein
MKKYLVTFLTLVMGFWLLVIPVNASCGGQYESPCYSYSILVDKMVAKPGTSDYVDNLNVSDPRFKPSEFVMFKLKIKNTSDTSFGGMTGKDFVPDYLTPIEGPSDSSFDSSTRTISWNAGAFAVDEEKTWYFKMQVNSQANLPADKGLFCVVNRVEASSNTTSDDDSSQLCIEKQIPQVQGVSTVVTVPATGPEMGIVLFAGEILALGTGIFLRRKV